MSAPLTYVAASAVGARAPEPNARAPTPAAAPSSTPRREMPAVFSLSVMGFPDMTNAPRFLVANVGETRDEIGVGSGGPADAGVEPPVPVEGGLVLPAVTGVGDVSGIPAVARHSRPRGFPVEDPDRAGVACRCLHGGEVGGLPGRRRRVTGARLRRRDR